jgi:potassium efflux system protein
MPSIINRHRGIVVSLLSCLILLILQFPALAQDETFLTGAERGAQALQTRLQQIERDLGVPGRSVETLSNLRAGTEKIRADGLAQVSGLIGPMADLQTQLTQLGPAPPGGQAEAPNVAAQRQEIVQQQARYAALKAELDLIITEAEQVSSRLAGLLQDQFLQQVFEPGNSIFHPSLWLNGLQAVLLMVQRLWTLVIEWLAGATQTSTVILPFFLALCLASVAAMLVAQRWARRLFDRRHASQMVTDLDRFWRAFRIGLLWFMFLAAWLLVVAAAATSLGLVTARIEGLFWAAATLLFNVVLRTSVIQAILSPSEPAWRLPPLNDRLAARISVLAIAAAVITAIRDFIDNITELLFLPLIVTAFRGAVSAIALCVILALILQLFSIRNFTPLATGHGYFTWMRFIRFPVLAGIAISAAALLLGYVALADFITYQIVDTLLLAVFFYLLYQLAITFFDTSIRPGTRIGRLLTENLFITPRGLDRLRVGLSTLADVALVVFGIPALLIQWTLTWIDFGSWVRSAVYGVEIGGLTLTFSNILLALIVLVIGISIANLFTRWLDGRVLSETQLDTGVRDSIRKATSYLGIALAAIAALTAAGLQFSNLALIAGALGVGIGFGLQSIVNNFVSGLILLAERPVKVGDWIQLATGEGLVKRINVRSTEIETFDNCTIIVPNSNLITEAVRNWTHRDTSGRFTIAVAAEYGPDPETIIALLKSLANEHRAVMSNPPAQAFFVGFGTTGMNFELKAHVADIFEAGFVASELRVAIDKAFKEKAIRIPGTPAAPPPPEPRKRSKS